MKYVLTAVVALCLSIGSQPAHAAKCKLVEDEFDSTLGLRVLTTDWMNLSHPMRPVGREMTGGVAARLYGDELFLVVGIEWLRFVKTYPSHDMINSSLTIPEGSELLIGLANGSVITLHSASIEVGETTYEKPRPRSGEEFAVTSKVAMQYQLDEEAEKVLLAQDAMAVRMRTSTDGDQDVRIYSGGTEHIKEAIECAREALK